jgi:hypothetical protein
MEKNTLKYRTMPAFGEKNCSTKMHYLRIETFGQCLILRYTLDGSNTVTTAHGVTQWRTYEFCSGGWRVQQIQLRTEGRKNGDLGGGTPLVRDSAQFENE